jgi:site-specific DNA-cytosine methylase
MMLATPKAADGLHPGVRNCKSGQTQHLSCQVIGDDAPKGAKLNPDFVSRMMGFPDNWVFTDKTCTGIPKLLTHEDLNEWITRSTDCNEDSERKDKLKALGNAVVPQCSAIIWHKLTDKIMKKIGARQFANI